MGPGGEQTTAVDAHDMAFRPKAISRTVRLPAGAPVSFFCRFHEASGMRATIRPAEGECRSA